MDKQPLVFYPPFIKVNMITYQQEVVYLWEFWFFVSPSSNSSSSIEILLWHGSSERCALIEFVIQAWRLLDCVGSHHTWPVSILVLVGELVINAELQTHIYDVIYSNPVVVFMFSRTGTIVQPWRGDGSDKPCAAIEPHTIMVQTGTWTRAARLKVWRRSH